LSEIPPVLYGEGRNGGWEGGETASLLPQYRLPEEEEEGEEEEGREEREEEASLDFHDVEEVEGEGEKAGWEGREEGGREGGCGNPKCAEEKEHLRNVVRKLRREVEAGKEEGRERQAEILDLRQQVAMLSGFGGGWARGREGGREGGTYAGEYDVVAKETVGAAVAAVAVAAAATAAANTATASSKNGGRGGEGREGGRANGHHPSASSSSSSLVPSTYTSYLRPSSSRPAAFPPPPLPPLPPPQQGLRVDPSLPIIQENEITIEKIVGVGSFGRVWKGTYRHRPVAIKCFYYPSGARGGGGGGGGEMDVVKEINLMARVNGRPHVLALEGVYLSSGGEGEGGGREGGQEAQVALVMPYMCNGSLHDILINPNSPHYRDSTSSKAVRKPLPPFLPPSFLPLHSFFGDTYS